MSFLAPDFADILPIYHVHRNTLSSSLSLSLSLSLSSSLSQSLAEAPADKMSSHHLPLLLLITVTSLVNIVILGSQEETSMSRMMKGLPGLGCFACR